MARKRDNANTQRLGLVRLPRAMLLRGTALQGVAALCAVLPGAYAHAQPAPNAHPLNPVTQLGSGSYGYNGTTTTINQHSQNLATGWSSFNVGSAQSVQINQPNSRAISVNRVAAGDPSQIAGHINANGVFVLVNPAGVVFSQGAQVNAASVVVSTADVANKNLAAGKLIFDRPGKPGAMIVNKGNITVKSTGLAALVAPGVVNAGTISAPFGRVALAGGEASVVDLYGDGLMSIDVTKQVTTVPNGPDGKPVAALVTNTGVIKATGGRIELSAKAVDGIVTNLVDAGGTIAADTARNGQTGTVVINGIGGSLTIEGDVSAAGKAPGTKGGAIELNASNAVNLTSTARVNASGKAGGGTVAIGTSLARAAGGPSVTGAPTAKTVTIAAGAKVSANATQKGNGGRVTVLSTDDTNMGGLIEARGGPLGGDAGFVEVSGDQGFALTGSIDVTAAMGNVGTILLDPTNLVIVKGTAGAGGLDNTLGSNNGITVGNGGTNGTVTTGEIESLTGTIILQAGSQLTFDNNASLSLANNASLILTTGSGDITTNNGADIVASGSGSITLLAGTNATGGITLNGNLTTDSGGSVLLQASGSIALSGMTISTGNLAMTAGSSLSVVGLASAAGGTIAVSTPQLTLGNNSSAGILSAAGGTVSVKTDQLSLGNHGGTLTAGSGVVEIAPQSSIAVAFGANSSTGTLGIPSQTKITADTLRLGAASGTTTASSIKIASATSLTTVGTIDFETTGGVTQSGSLAGVAISGNAGSVVLTNANNHFTSIGNLTGSTGIALSSKSDLPLDGVLQANSGTIIVNAGSHLMTVSGSVIAPEATLAAGTLAIPGSIDVTGLGSLIATSSSIAGAGQVTLGTLVASAGTAIALTGTNAIGSIGSVSSTGFTLANTGSLSIDGLLNAGSGHVAIDNGTSDLTLASGGSIHAAQASITAGAISLAGKVGVSGLMSLVSSVGGISESSGAVLSVGTLTGASATDTALILGGNTIATLGSFAAGGSFALADTAALLVDAPVSGTAVSLSAPKLTLGGAATDAGTLVASSGPVSIQTGSLVVGAAGGTISAGATGTIEFAPQSTGDIIVLGTAGAGTLAIDPSATGLTLTYGTLRLGAVNGTTVAGSIAVASGAGAYTIPGTLDLEATGGVTQSTSLTATRLTGTVGSLTLTNPNNQITTIGDLTAADGFSLNNKGGVTIAGALDANAGTVVIGDDTSISLSGSATAMAATLTAPELLIGGTLNATNAALFSTTGSIEETGGTMNLVTLTGSAATGALFGGTNAIGTLGAFTAADIVLNNGSSDLSISGPVAYANSATFTTTGSLSVPGTIAPIAAASSITLGLTAGPAIDIGGVISDGGTGSTTLMVNSGSGVVTAGGTVIAGTLTGTAAVATLTGSANAIGTLASFAASQSLVIVDAADLVAIGTIGGGSVVAIQAPSLQLGDGTTAAILSAPNGVVGVRTDSLSLGAAGEGTIAAGSGVVEISGITRTVIALGNVNSAGTLGLDFTGLDITGGTLRLGSFDGTTVATAIEIDGSGDLHTQFGTLDLRASGSVTQTDSLIVGTLMGNAGSVVLDSATNSIGTLGAFSAANGFTLVDGSGLTVAGLVSSGTGSVALNTGSLGLGIASGAGVTGAAIGLTAGSIDIGGSLDTPGILTLAASQGAINEDTTGFVGALELTGSAAGAVSLLGSSNALGTIAGFSAVNGFTLTNAASLTATGVIDAHSGSVVINNGTFGLALNGTVTAMAASLSAGSIDLNGLLGVPGLVMLNASQGAITEASGAFLNAGTLAGSAHGIASLLGTNAVGTLGDFSADSLLLNAGTAGLTIAGVVTAGHTVDIAAGGLIAVDGSIIPVAGSTLAISLSGDTLTLSGLISDGGNGTTGLFSTNGGTITETGSLIVGTLTGSASVADFSAGSNTIVALGDFTAGTLLLDDTAGLTVSGVVTVGTTVALIDTGSIDITGSILPTAGSIIGVGLTASNLTITGLVSDGGSGSTVFSVDGGTIAEPATGTVIAGTLGGTAAVATLLGSANAIGELNGFSTSSSLVVVDTGALLLAGTIAGGTLVSISAGTLSDPVLVTGTNVTLAATQGTLGLTGTIDASGAVNLSGSAGIDGASGLILGNGSVTAVSSAGAVTLTNTLNVIGTIAGSAATDFLVNASSAVVAGNIDAGTQVSIVTAGSLTVSGSIAPLAGITAIAVGLTADGIAISGGVSDGGAGTTWLDAGTGALTGAGRIVAGTLSASGSVFGLIGSNDIGAFGTLANFASIVLNDVGSLLIGGPISATTLIAITAPTLTVENTISAPSATLSATGGTLTLGSTIDVTGNLALSGSAGIDGAGATIIGGGSVTANSSGGSVDLTNTGNIVAGVDGSAHGDFRFRSGTGLGVGDVTAGGTADLTAPSIGVTGTVAAAHATLVASSGSLDIGSTAVVRPSVDAFLSASGGLLSIEGAVAPASGNVALTLTGATLDIAGLVSDGGQGTTNLLVNGGTITETGTLIAGTLSGTAVLASLTDPGFSNQVATLGAFTGDTLVFNDGTALTIAGPVSIGSVIAINDSSSISVPGTIAPIVGSVISIGLTATALDITGLVSDSGSGNTALQINGGTIAVTAGTLVAGTLTGTASVVTLTGSSIAIADLGAFGADTSFTLVDSTALTVTGPAGGAPVVDVTAPSITVGGSGSTTGTLSAAPGGRLSITTGTLIAGSGGGTLAATNGTIEVAPANAADTVALGGISSAGTLGFIPSDFAIDADRLSIGGHDGAVASGAVIVTGSAPTVVNVPTLDVRTGGTFSQSMSLTAQTLTGTAAAVALTAAGNSISTIGAFSAPGGFALTNAAALSVAGSLASSAGSVILNTGTFGLGIPGAISAVAVSLSAGSIDVGGSLVAQTVATLVASVGSISVTGLLNAGTLTGSAADAASFGGVENVGTLGDFFAGSGFSLTQSQALTVAGNVAAPSGSVAIDTGSFGLTIPGTIGGAAAFLTAASIDLTGSLGVSGLATLIASQGSIAEAGSAFLSAGTLTGSVVTTAAFDGTNAIGTLGDFTAPAGFRLADGEALNVAGSVLSSGGSVVIDAGSFGLGVSGAVAAPTVTLAAGSIDIGGSVGATGVVQLLANQGSIAETGSLDAGTLTGSAITTAFLTGTNLVGTLGSFTAPGGFSLNDGQALSVTGSVASSGGTVALNTGTFGIDVPGTITGAAAALTGGSIDIGGSLGVTGLATLIASLGSIDAPGFVNAGTLTGSAVSTAQFTGTNLVGTLGNFAAPDGFTLIDSQALAVTGSVAASAGTVALNTGTFGLGVAGAITGLAATLSAGSIDLGGSLGVSGVASLIANQGSINETGSLSAGTLIGSAITTAGFGGSNLVGTLGSFTAPGGFTLANGQALSVAGAVAASGGTVALNVGTFGLSVPGAVSGLAATLIAGSIDIGGSLGVSGIASLVASQGSISVPGSLNAGTLTGSAVTTARFDGSNQIGTLGNFAAPTSFSLTDGHALTVAGALTSGGSVTIDDAGSSLSVPGTIAGGPVLLSAAAIDIGGQVGSGAVTLVSTGSIGATGAITATSLQGSAATTASLTGSNVIATLNDFTSPDGFTLNNGHSLGVPGSVSASAGTVAINNGTFALDIPGTISGSAVTLGAGTIGLTGSLNATGVAALTAVSGAITEATTAFLTAGTLTGGVVSSATFNGTNVIGTLGLFDAPSGFSLIDGVALSVAGAVTANGGTVVLNTGTFGLGVPGAISAASATLTAGSIDIGGSVGVTGAASLIANQGSISETGSLNAGTLTGSAITTASFGGTNLVGTLANFTAPNGFTLTDGEALSVTGAVASASGAIALNTGTFGLSVPGGLSGLSATLTAGSIALDGSLGVTGVADLVASQGAISQTGTLNAGTLTGSAITTASFGGTNLVGTLADFSAPNGFTLSDGEALTVTGAVSAASGAVALNTGTFGLSVPGGLSAASASLTAGSISIDGSLGVSGTASLIANQGAIGETGSLNAGTLTGSAITTASFDGTNLIGTLANFTAPNGFRLTDGEALSVTGAVASASGAIVLNTGTFGLSVPGGLSGLSATLTAGSIALDGSLGVTGVADLVANQGSIGQTGTLNAGTLTGSAITTASFGGTNLIGTLADFTAPNGFALSDGEALSVTGAVASSAGAVSIDTGTALLSVPGSVTGQSVSLTAGTLTIPGSLGAAGLALLTVNGGTITETGVISAGTLAGAAAVASLTGTSATANQIGTLGSFTAGTLTLHDGLALNIAGPVGIGASLAIVESGLLSVTGSVTPTSGNIAIGLTAATLGISGLVSAGPSGSADLSVASGAITETTGTLVAGTLTGVADTALLNGPANAIAKLGNFAAGSTLIVLDTGSLLVSGSVTAGVLASITAPTLTASSLVDAPNTTLTATSGTLALTGTVNAIGSAVLSGAQAVAGANALLTGGGTVTASSASGAVTLTNTLNSVGAVNGSAATSFAFGDSAALTIGQVSAGSAVSIAANGALTLAGTIAPTSGTAIAVGLTAASLLISGLLSDGGAGTTTIDTNPGGITETGTIIAGTFSATGTILALTGSNTIAALGNIDGGPTLIVIDTSPLTVAGLATASNLAAISAPVLTVTGTVLAPSTTLTATTGTLGLSGTVNATTEALLSGAAGIAGASGLITGGGVLTASSSGGSVVLTNPLNSVTSVDGAAAGDFLFVNSGSVGVGKITAGGVASIDAASIGVSGAVAAPNVTLVASSGDLSISGAVEPSASGTLTADNGTISVLGGASVAPPSGAIALALQAQQIVIDGLVSDGGAGSTSLIVPRSTGTIQEAGTLIAGVLSGTASLWNLVDPGSSNQIATLGAFDAGTLIMNDATPLEITGPVTIGSLININDTAPIVVSGTIAPSSGAQIAVGLTASAMTISGMVSDGGGGTTSLVTTDGSITETGALVAGVLTGSAAGGGPAYADVSLIGANQIGTLGNFDATGNMLIQDGTSLRVAGSVLGGTHGGAGGAGATSVEIDVLGASANLTVASGSVIHAGVDGALTGNVTLRAGSDTLAGGVEIDGGIYAANGGSIMVTAGYNVGSDAWNVVGSGSSITLTGTLWGDQSGGGLASLVSLGAAGSIDEPVTSAAIGANLLSGRAGGHANFGETANGALAPVASANQIANLGNFLSNAGTDDPLGFLLRDGRALTVTGPVIDLGASASRGIAISVVPGSGAAYSAADLTIAGRLQAQTTVNPQATGNVTEVAGGSIIARTLTTQSGVIPSTETSGNTAGTYPATVIAGNASAFYGNASGQNVNQIGTLTNVTTTGTLSLYDTPNLTVAGNVITGITPAGLSSAGSIAIGTGMTLVTPGVLSVFGLLDVASQSGVLSLSGSTVQLGGALGTATLKAATMQVFGASGVGVADNTVLYTGGDLFRRPASGTPPIDPGPATAGAHFFVGPAGFIQTGKLSVLPYVADTATGSVGTEHPELDIRLTSGTGPISFDYGEGLDAPATSLLLTLGTSGSASGHVTADTVAVFYSGTSGNPTTLYATLYTSAGISVSGQSAASQSFISRDGVYVPSNHFQVNACSISSINCVMISPFAALPILNPLRDLPTEFLTDESDDPDLLIPNVSDRED